jgi:hypothetical protein
LHYKPTGRRKEVDPERYGNTNPWFDGSDLIGLKPNYFRRRGRRKVYCYKANEQNVALHTEVIVMLVHIWLNSNKK